MKFHRVTVSIVLILLLAFSSRSISPASAQDDTFQLDADNPSVVIYSDFIGMNGKVEVSSSETSTGFVNISGTVGTGVPPGGELTISFTARRSISLSLFNSEGSASGTYSFMFEGRPVITSISYLVIPIAFIALVIFLYLQRKS